MDGPEGAVTRVCANLRAELPRKLAELRTRYGVVDGSLPDIDRYLTHEPLDISIDRPPMIVVVEQESDTLDGPVKLTTDGGGGSLYEFRYRIVVYAWSTGTDAAVTTTARQRYGLAVREVMLQRLGLGVPDPGTLVLDPVTIGESYSGVETTTAREIIAATAITCEYRAQEFLEPYRPGVPAVAGTVTTGVDG